MYCCTVALVFPRYNFNLVLQIMKLPQGFVLSFHMSFTNDFGILLHVSHNSQRALLIVISRVLCCLCFKTQPDGLKAGKEIDVLR